MIHAAESTARLSMGRCPPRTDFCPLLRNQLFSSHMALDRNSSAGEGSTVFARQSAAWIGILILLAAALRLFRLGVKSFWLDEATSVVMAQVNAQTLVFALIHRQGNMALYYLLLRGWSLLGGSEFLIRLLSVIFGVAAVPAIYFLGRELYEENTGRIAALLLSVHVFHIHYSQEARGYSLFVLLAIVSSYFCVRMLQAPSGRNLVGYVTTGALMVYAQAFGGWVLLAQFVFLLFERRSIGWKNLLGLVVSIGILIAPLAYCVLFVSDRSQLRWTRPLSLETLYQFCMDLTSDGGLPLLLLYFLLAAIPVLKREPTPFPSRSFLLLWLLVPVAAVLSLSLWWPAFEPRYLIACVPPLVLLAAEGLAQIHSRILFAAAGLLMLGLSLNGVYYYHQARAHAQTDNWRDATRYVITHAEPRDAVLFSYSEERLAFDEYRRRLHLTESVIPEYPNETELELLTRRPSRADRQLIEEIAGQYGRVWVLSAFQANAASRKVDAVLKDYFRENSQHSFGFVHAELLERRSAAETDPTTSKSE